MIRLVLGGRMPKIQIETVREAQARIAPYIRRTPFIPFDFLSLATGKELWLKCESLQRTGSFKIRGAANFILSQLAQAKKCGVVAASAGNHAQAVASMAKALGIRSTIVMPTITPPIKVQNTRRWGADVELVGDVYDDSFEHAMTLAKTKGFLFIHPFADPLVIAGQGTIGLELAESNDFSDIEAVAIGVGGGGLSTGIAAVLHELHPKVKIYGVVARNAPSAWKSFHKKSLVSEPVSFTLAEGVAVKRPNEQMLGYMQEYLDDMIALSEESIANAIAVLTEQGKLVVEGAGALPVAAIIEGLIPEKKVALILSGGNIDIPALSHVLQRGLVEQGRMVRLMISVSDRPGGLNAVTDVLASQRANIMQIFHQRSSIHTKMDEAEIEVDLETRGPDHTKEITAALTGRGFRVKCD